MISKIYEIGAKYKLTRMGGRKGKPNKEKADLYRDAARLSRLQPSIKRVVRYNKTKGK